MVAAVLMCTIFWALAYKPLVRFGFWWKVISLEWHFQYICMRGLSLSRTVFSRNGCQLVIEHTLLEKIRPKNICGKARPQTETGSVRLACPLSDIFFTVLFCYCTSSITYNATIISSLPPPTQVIGLIPCNVTLQLFQRLNNRSIMAR